MMGQNYLLVYLINGVKKMSFLRKSLGSSLTGGMVARWKFNEGVGITANDSSPFANHATFGATAPSWESTQYGTSLLTSAVGQTLTVGTGRSLDVVNKAFSFSVWLNLKTDVTAGRMGSIFYKCTATLSGSGWGIGYDKRSGTGFNLYKAGVADQRISLTLSLNTWYHIVAVQLFSGGNPLKWALYSNGTFIGYSANNTSSFQSSIGQNAIIGDSTFASADCFRGNINDLRIYNRELSNDEIRMLYTEKVL